MTAAEILRMVETVSPDDTAKLDEIDARVLCYLNNWEFKQFEGSWIRCVGGYKFLRSNDCFYRSREYTRSRDALKQIRPEGWEFNIERIANPTQRFKYQCIAFRPGSLIELTENAGPTEELAELHAIIQAIKFERGTA